MSSVEDIKHLQYDEFHCIDSHTSSEATLGLARTWLDRCLQKHSSCKLLSLKKDFVPARLIDTEPLPGSEWRLWITAKNEYRPATYTTLSHRWGTASFLNLTTQNIGALEAGRPLSALPKTFREAVEIARRLGVRFLWIDSLCILQDSLGDKDWQEQSAAMRDIYTHSVCNIAATGAADSHGGCYFPRDVSRVIPCTISKNSQGSLSVDFTVVSMDLWTDDIERAQLNQRGWVLQERLLAPRTLHFAAQQIFWECNEMNACEMYPKELPSTHFLDDQQPSIRCHRPLFSANAGKSDENFGQQPYSAQDPYFYWSRIVDAYSRCYLTRPEDKLAALSGLASQLQQMTKDDYYAGLWSKDLAGQLLWTIVGCVQADGTASRRPEPYRAPTWSWASVDGVVKTNDLPFDGSFGKPLFDVVDVRIVPLTGDITGQVRKGAYLCIKGVLTKASIVSGPEGVARLRIGKQDGRIVFRLDTRLGESLSDVSCVPIGHYMSPTYQNRPSIQGLILHRSEAEGHSYTRLGMFRVESRAQCEELGLEFEGDDSLGGYPAGSARQSITML